MRISLLFGLCSLILMYCGCGAVINPIVKMYVAHDNIVLISGQGTFDFGTVYIDDNNAKTIFQITNEGKKTLVLTGVPDRIKLEGTNSSEFTVDETLLKSEIGANKSTTFEVSFMPKSIGLKTATVIIYNNDEVNPEYAFYLTGNAVTPEIVVKQGNTILNSGSSVFDFKEMYVGYSGNESTFRIMNTGSGDLNLNGSPNKISISGNNSTEFSINQSTTLETIAPSNFTTFSISFEPNNVGNKTATISIANNDLDDNPFTFTIKGLAIDPGIIILDSAQNAIVNGSGIFDFGDVLRSDTKQETFTIKNLGSSNLQLFGNPTITGSGANKFSIISQPSSIIQPGNSTTFKIQFVPGVSNSFNAIVTILNNDVIDNPYVFTIKGRGVEPEINIQNSLSSSISSGTGIFDFGIVLVSSHKSETFTIQNLGSYNLTLNGTPKVALSGSGASAFSVTAQPSSPVAPSSSTTFTIEFAPTNPVNYSITVSIVNNDFNENPYTFTLKGAGIKPEINVRYGSTNIPSGSGSYDFGTGFIGYQGQSVVFTIENLGNSQLNLTGSPKIAKSGADATMFTITQTQTTTPIYPGNSTTFSIVFSPTSTGNKTATISIANNDSDENPYTFTIKGYGEQPAPEINIKQGATDIPHLTGIYDFRNVKVGKSTQYVVFTIENLGVLNLNLNGTLRVAISGPNASEFAVNLSSLSSSIAPGSSTTFGLKFSPTSAGQKTATVSIANNDTDENPYTFTVKGTGVKTTFDFNGDGYDDVIVGAYADDDGGSISGCAFIFFGSSNPTSSMNAANANVKLVGGNSGDRFGICVSNAGDVNNDGFDDVIVGAHCDDDYGMDSGCAFIFYGSSNPPSTIDASNANVKLMGAGDSAFFGRSVSGAGDVNNDGFDDVIVGADNANKASILFGKSNLASSIYAANMDVKISGLGSFDMFGCCVSNVGDFNKDGFDDVIIGAYSDDDGGTGSGCAFIYFGRQSWSSNLNTTDADVKLVGADANDAFGVGVSGAGDINNDGYDDVIVGAPGDDDGGGGSGCAFVFFGRSNAPSSIDASNANIKLVGANADDLFGNDVSRAGDFNNDGIDDILVGAVYADDGGNRSGCAYIFYGSSNPSSIIDAGNANVKLIGAGSLNEFGTGISYAGDFNGDGMDDIIVGANRAENNGFAYVFYGKSSPASSINATNANVKIKGDSYDDNFGYSVAGGH